MYLSLFFYFIHFKLTYLHNNSLLNSLFVILFFLDDVDEDEYDDENYEDKDENKYEDESDIEYDV